MPARQQAMAAQAQAAAQSQAAGDEEQPEEAALGSRFLLLNAVPSWLTSMILHVIVLLVMALITFQVDKNTSQELVVNDTPVAEEIEEFKEEKIEPLDVQDLSMEVSPLQVQADIPDEQASLSPINELEAAPTHVELDPLGESAAPKTDLLTTWGAYMGTGLQGRGAGVRGQMLNRYGGTAGSEAAVLAALRWLADHQLPDGSWSFDHTLGSCRGRCSNPGNFADARNGATGLALLPFLGFGQTHLEGQYKETVQRGLYYLLTKMKVKNVGGYNAGDLSDSEGNSGMYSHGIAAIALCEAYAMTKDKNLMGPAQLGINHIVYAQDPVGGGWRYQPRQAGDTSVVGWQLMALKSGHMAYLNVPPQTVKMASKFLDSVQSDYGSKYGYTSPGGRPGTTSVGLLSRMYLGWKKDHPGIIGGVEYLGAQGPSKGNMYYNYYATQVMRHYEGDAWKKWNEVMREQLVTSQSQQGHEKGSWYFRGGERDHGADRGGRLYFTAMSTMVLEVYYRHMPIYQESASKEDFAL
jgi:hypothetical protein